MSETPPTTGMARAVRRATRHSPVGDQPCPGAEPLAAFVEDRLSDEEHSAVVAHLADCERCQLIVAVLVQADAAVEPQQSAEAAAVEPGAGVPNAQTRTAAEVVAFPVRPARVPWRWVAPVAAVTAAVLAWVVVRPLEVRRRPRPAAGEVVARLEERPSVLEAVEPVQPAAESRDTGPLRQTPSPSGAPRPEGGSTPRAGDSAPPAGPSVAPPAAAPAVPPLQDSSRRPTDTESSTTREVQSAASSAPSRDSTTASSPGPGATQAALEEQISVGAPPTGASLAQQKAAASQSEATAGSVNTPPRAEQSLERRQADARARRSGGLLWRIVTGRFEVSRDGGNNWTATVLPEGADVSLAEVVGQPSPANAAIASASRSDVWWLAGRRGFVARVADGRLAISAPPSADDVVAFERVDVARATVRTSVGSVFETLDAGRTWRLVSPR